MNTPKPSPRDLEREARRLTRIRQLEAVEPRVIELRAATIPLDRRIDPEPDPKQAA